MAQKRKIEIFSAGCGLCEETIEMVNQMACSNCEVSILDMKNAGAVARAKDLGVRSLPAVAVNGVLASCCAGRGPDGAALRAAGVGTP
ncbi:MAG: thioredoxin family protein [Alphaproteobacteria bacterium]|uniref:thioredoxin family protein n=1 Tax=Nisaea sp. TaxID=2024842 RepID=UPI0032651CAE